ncbi:MAG TPA: hypothetical protein VFG94_04820, partial [Acidimicrobiales bacterium]|nr:hypothetical protein [Acidimicrobiales bacterium]
VDRRLVLRWLVWFLQCLSAAWLATAILYAVSIGTLPKLIVAVAAAVAVAFLVATVAVATGLDQPRVTTLATSSRFHGSPQPGPYQQRASGGPGSRAPSEPARQRTQPDRPPAEQAADRPAPDLDLTVFLPRSPVDPDPRQCPRCGSFAVTTAEDASRQATSTCRTCRQTWHSGAGLPDPDVVVRSWLHR